MSGYTTSLEGLEAKPVDVVALENLGELEDPFILDVRTRGEHEVGKIPGTVQLHGGRLLWNLDELPKDRPIVTYCQSGARSAVAASTLRAAGYENVLELEGSYEAWKKEQGERFDS